MTKEMSINVSDRDSDNDEDYDPDPRFISEKARYLPSWTIPSSCCISAESPECILSLVTCHHDANISLAALLSDFWVSVHDPETLQQCARFSHHTDHVRALRSMPDSPGLFTASEDGNWKLFDLRTGSVQLSVQSDEPLYSFDCNGVLAVAGKGASDVALWDIRNCSSVLGVLDEFHTDEVRDVRFHPTYKSMLFTGSVDCLINKFDLNASSLDDALISVFNTNQSVRLLNFFGPHWEFLYSISEIETLSLCNLSTDELICTMDDICSTLSADVSVRYLVDCYFDFEQRSLSIFAGNYYGDMIGAFIAPNKLDSAVTLLNGHSSGIRALASINNILYTAGEDSRITSWKQTSCYVLRLFSQTTQ